MVDAEKIAVCLNCGNEWPVRSADTKKRKCPVCGKYRVKMKSEMTAEELQAAKGAHPEENTGEKEEKNRRREENSPPGSPPSPEEEEGEKGEEKTGGSFLLYAGILILALSAGWFLWRAYQSHRAESNDSEEDGEMRRYVRA